MGHLLSENTPSRRQMAENIIATMIIRGLVGGGRGFMLVVIARVYGPAEFGKLAVVIATVDILRNLAEFGLGVTAIRRLARLENVIPRMAGLNLVGGSAAFLLGLLFVALAYEGSGYVFLMAILGMSLYTQSLIATFQSYFQAHLAMRLILRASVFGGVLYVGSTLAAAFGRVSLAGTVLLIPGTEAVVLFLVHRIWRAATSDPSRIGGGSVAYRALLREALPVAVTSLLVTVYLRGDNLLLSWLGGAAAVGTYAACSRLLDPLLMAAGAGATTFLASLSRRQEPAEARAFVKRIYTPLFAVAGVVSVLAFFLSPWLARIILPSYPDAGPILRILSCSLALRTVSMNLTTVIYSRGRYGWITRVAIVNVFANLLLNILLIPAYGGVGSALAIVTSEGLSCILQGLACRSLLRSKASA